MLAPKLRFSNDIFIGSRPPFQQGPTFAGSVGPQADVPGVMNSLALRSLGLLYEDQEKLFTEGLSIEATHQRYHTSRTATMIAMLGLRQLAGTGATLPFDLNVIGRTLLHDLDWVASIRDLGLLTWVAAVCMPDRMETLLQHVDYRAALESYPDARRAETESLAFFLAGLSHLRLVCPELTQDLTDLAAQSYRLLSENVGESGLFGHAASSGHIGGSFWSRHGTITDQMHAVHALTAFSRAFEIDDPLEAASNCANVVCSLQGEKGQWWYLYDKVKGRVASYYPVRCVNQDGIVPAALTALEMLIGRSFDATIRKSLSWIGAQNELGIDLRDWNQGLIWDSIAPRGFAKLWQILRSHLRVPSLKAERNLQVNREVRTEHFGWLLFAFGNLGLAGNAPARSISALGPV